MRWSRYRYISQVGFHFIFMGPRFWQVLNARQRHTKFSAFGHATIVTSPHAVELAPIPSLRIHIACFLLTHQNCTYCRFPMQNLGAMLTWIGTAIQLGVFGYMNLSRGSNRWILRWWTIYSPLTVNPQVVIPHPDLISIEPVFLASLRPCLKTSTL